jgi:hypothetical protein
VYPCPPLAVRWVLIDVYGYTYTFLDSTTRDINANYNCLTATSSDGFLPLAYFLAGYGYNPLYPTPVKYPSHTTPRIQQSALSSFFYVLYFFYTPITPYIIREASLDNIRQYLPQYYTAWATVYTYYLYDLDLLDRYSDTDPVIDAKYQAALNITYTRDFDGKTYTHTVPVSIEERSCPAYMKE